ncbi:ras-related and estrogen-regulated growth inhibitor [Vanacampus margaritifer]
MSASRLGSCFLCTCRPPSWLMSQGYSLLSASNSSRRRQDLLCFPSNYFCYFLFKVGGKSKLYGLSFLLVLMISDLYMGTATKRKEMVKLLILGTPNTGKTALCVRFLTKRFIGEYDHKKEVTYRCCRLVDQEAVDLEILDTASKESCALSLEASIRWADGFLLLYSITHRQSFLEVSRLKGLIDQTKQSLVLVANKADLEIGREVTTEEGQRLALDLRCSFRELSVADTVLAVEATVFQLIRRVLDQQRLVPDRRSYMLTVRHALTRKLTRSKTMQW